MCPVNSRNPFGKRPSRSLEVGIVWQTVNCYILKDHHKSDMDRHIELNCLLLLAQWYSVLLVIQGSSGLFMGKTLQSPSLVLVKPRKDMKNVSCCHHMNEILLKGAKTPFNQFINSVGECNTILSAYTLYRHLG